MKKSYFIITAISLFSLIIITVISKVSIDTVNRSNKNASVKETEYIYVYKDSDTATESTAKKESWIVKEYKGRIGIFDSDGKLVEVIDTYIKTLPEKDRLLLGEGMEISDKKALISIIEAYSD